MAVGPQVGDIAPVVDEVVRQLQFVDMRLGRALNPFSTPQTLLLDSEGRPRWHRKAALNDDDVAEAMKTLQRVSETE